MVAAEPRDNGAFYVPDLKITVNTVYATMEEAAKEHLRRLKAAMIENDIKISKLMGKMEPQPPVTLEQLARYEMAKANDHLFKKTKIPYLWIVK